MFCYVPLLFVDSLLDPFRLRIQAVMTRVKGSFWKANLLSIWMNSYGTTLFTTRTVDELLWGYEDPLLVSVSVTSPDVETVFGLMYKASTFLQKLLQHVFFFFNNRKFVFEKRNAF